MAANSEPEDLFAWLNSTPVHKSQAPSSSSSSSSSSSTTPGTPPHARKSGRSGRSFDDDPSASSKALRQFGSSRQPSSVKSTDKQVVAVPRIVCELSRSLEAPLTPQELCQIYELLLRYFYLFFIFLIYFYYFF